MVVGVADLDLRRPQRLHGVGTHVGSEVHIHNNTSRIDGEKDGSARESDIQFEFGQHSQASPMS